MDRAIFAACVNQYIIFQQYKIFWVIRIVELDTSSMRSPKKNGGSFE
jgi:hypothetical protein